MYVNAVPSSTEDTIVSTKEDTKTPTLAEFWNISPDAKDTKEDSIKLDSIFEVNMKKLREEARKGYYSPEYEDSIFSTKDDELWEFLAAAQCVSSIVIQVNAVYPRLHKSRVDSLAVWFKKNRSRITYAKWNVWLNEHFYFWDLMTSSNFSFEIFNAYHDKLDSFIVK